MPARAFDPMEPVPFNDLMKALHPLPGVPKSKTVRKIEAWLESRSDAPESSAEKP